jgi:hypothetical protein
LRLGEELSLLQLHFERGSDLKASSDLNALAVHAQRTLILRKAIGLKHLTEALGQPRHRIVSAQIQILRHSIASEARLSNFRVHTGRAAWQSTLKARRRCSALTVSG